MHMRNLKQAAFNCTLMGAVRGVADCYGIEVTTPALYGLSGHAFLINIHNALCPSGPYCWNRVPFFRLLRNVGLEVTDLGFFHGESTPAERAAVDAKLRESLGAGTPCSLINMENQLITGMDETGFLTAQPWAPHVDFPPKHLTFGTWSEFGGECHVNFFTFAKVTPADRRQAVLDSLAYAVDLDAQPLQHTSRDYGIGPNAYANWIAAVEDGHGAGHGNWWNAMVWAECREMAGGYLAEIGRLYPAVAALAQPLAERYTQIGKDLGRASDKAMPAVDKVALLKAVRESEATAVRGLAELATALRAL